ncbi:MAG: hypothetical protein ACOYY2_00715 [Actinomycetota bacterium]
MTAAHDHEELHHLVDRLPPDQARRLRGLIEADPELARFAESDHDVAGEGQRPLSIVGIWESGRGDLSERHDEIIRERLKRSAWRGG